MCVGPCRQRRLRLLKQRPALLIRHFLRVRLTPWLKKQGPSSLSGDQASPKMLRRATSIAIAATLGA